MSQKPLGWLGILRFGLIQMSIGSAVVLTTSTLNRVMVVELALPAMLPGALVGLHYAIQILRPRWGYGSDIGGRRTPWIIGGMMVLVTGVVLAACATGLMATDRTAGIALAVFAFLTIGAGAGACGTSLLVLLAIRVDERKRAAAATTVWLMMIAGLAVTASVAGQFLDPYSPGRLIAVTGCVAAIAMTLTLIGIWGVEGRTDRIADPRSPLPQKTEAKKGPGFFAALRDVWSESSSRRFALFVFVSMFAYSAQDLILEPFAGTVFGMTPGESTQLSGLQHGGVFIGMVMVALFGSVIARGRYGSMRAWAVGGCIASAFALFAISAAGSFGPAFPIQTAVFALGVANGAFAVAAIGSMMGLVREGREKREGTRMGMWGAAQGIAFGLGGFMGTVAVDSVRFASGSPETAYAAVFAIEGILFVLAGYLALRVTQRVRKEAFGFRAGTSASST